VAYTKQTWTQNVSAVNATRMTALETQYDEAIASMGLDAFTAGFVFSGLLASKNASTATQLDITSGTAYLKQAADSSYRRRAISSTTKTTVTINTTYYLDLNPDGTYSWATSHSATANYIPIAEVTTDGSGNISTVKDKRTLTASYFGSGVMAPAMGSATLVAPVTPSLAGLVMGGVTFGAAGMAGGDDATSATFNGTTGYISTPSTGLSSGATAFSMGCTFSYPSNQQGFLISLGQPTANKNMSIQLDSSGRISTTNFSAGTTAAAVSSGTTHRAALTWDGTNVRLYVDGALTGGPTALPSQNTTPTGYGFTIGAQPNGGAQYSNATIQDVWYVPGSAISSGTVTTLYNASRTGGYLAAMVAAGATRVYRLGEAAGATWANCSIASTLQTLGTDGSATLGRIAGIGGQSAAGNLGAPVIVGTVLEYGVVVNTQQTVLTWTAPNRDSLVRVSADLLVGASNTNNGTVTLQITYTDLLNGSISLALYNSATLALLSAVSLTKGACYHAMPVTVMVLAGGSISLKYQNSAAGTIGDKVTGVFELLS
jgi:hypothetical protein